MGKRICLEDEIKKLLSLKATSSDTEWLEEAGIRVKNPTKLTVLAAALYKKAAGGDLSALKEILARSSGEESASGGVMLIDDIGNKAE